MTKDKQRERLVELLCNIPKKEVTYFGRSCGKKPFEQRRHYPINDRCIVPIYNIGETVYLVLSGEVIEATVKEITKTTAGIYYKVEIEGGLYLKATSACLYPTKKEAEKKKRSNKDAKRYK